MTDGADGLVESHHVDIRTGCGRQLKRCQIAPPQAAGFKLISQRRAGISDRITSWV